MLTCNRKFGSPSCLLASVQLGSDSLNIITASITNLTLSGGFEKDFTSAISFLLSEFKACISETCIYYILSIIIKKTFALFMININNTIYIIIININNRYTSIASFSAGIAFSKSATAKLYNV